MASSGGDVPAERAAVVVNDLVEAREDAARLRSLILQLDDHHRSPWAELVDGVLRRLSSAMSALDVSGAAAGGQSSAAGSDGARQSASSSGIARKRSFSRRSQGSPEKRITATLDDGENTGKKRFKIRPTRVHRSYFRCTHKSDQGCSAKRHVQLCEVDPSKYVVTYYGEHTCRDPSTMFPIVHNAGAALDRANNLISFGPSYTNTATGASSQQLAMDGSITQLSTSWCTSEDVFSSSAGSFFQADELGAVVGSAGVMSTTAAGSAPDYGWLGDLIAGGGGTGAGSFHSSPNSHDLVVGSLGSIGDGDFFQSDLDP